jgi:hypothetical protein
VYYGFSEAFVKYGTRTMPHFQEWSDHMHALLRQEGVHYAGT